MVLANKREKKMDRENVIDMMTDVVIKLNREIAAQQNVKEDTIEDFINMSTPQFKYVNGLLYDLLDSNGLIK
jgi:hypothetical protein